jgi:ABC-type multidrug transport system ATPase subunit
VAKRYGSRCALADVDLVVEEGEVVALLGRNGSGKTTLLRLVAGLTMPSGGGVSVHGFRAGSLHARRRVAFVPDEPAGLGELTVAEHVALLRSLADAPDEPGERAVADLGLEEHLSERVGRLSRGLRRRTALAAALAAAPSVLLVDEATVTLDAGSVVALTRVLRDRARDGGATVLATHDVSFAERACDRIEVLRGGRVVGRGPARTAAALVALAGGALDASDVPGDDGEPGAH